MATAGQIPKTATTKRLEGNPGHKPIKDDLPAPSGLPDMPRELDGDASKEWLRVTSILNDIGILSTLDLSVIATYCQAWARYLEIQRAMKFVDISEMIEEPRSGYERLLNQSFKISEQLRKLLPELGLSPAARARIHVPKKKADDSSAEKFFDA